MVRLPIDGHIPAILDAVRRARAAVIVAAPGAGKTTRVPPALAADGRVLLLQPRRVAARAIARRMAEEQGWTLGEDVGWHVRFERRFTPSSRIVVATEGILTARLQQDPLASDVRTIVLDEFHERSIHADLGLALARQAWSARDDLRIVVMSATIDPGPVQAFLDGCPLLEVEARTHPLQIDYAPSQTAAAAVRELAPASQGRILCFLPGAREIDRAREELARTAPGLDSAVLHGSLPSDEQDRALTPVDGRPRVILATNIAETSLTVPHVDIVVDTGLHKVARYDAARGIDSLQVERITRDSADQRAGRAARLGPGRVRRLWDAAERLRPHRQPDIARVDLAGPMLDVLAWGGRADTFEWFEAPPAHAAEAALALLDRLGAVHGGTVTPLGREMQALALHPRLARILLAAAGAREAALACALLSERNVLPPRHEATSCDLLAAIDGPAAMPGHVRQVARAIEEAAARALGHRRRTSINELELRHAIFQGYADRLALRRESAGSRLLLASGTGARLAAESGVREGRLLVALDVSSSAGPLPTGEALVRLASRVEPEWVSPTGTDDVHVFDEATGRVRAVRRTRFGALVLSEHAVDVDPVERARLLADAYLARPLSDADRRLRARLAFAGLEVDLARLVHRASPGARSIDRIDPGAHLDRATAAALERGAPDTVQVPSGRRLRLEYEDDGTVTLAVKLQELFGLADGPRVGRDRQAVVLQLLAPNGRPVQTTRDLRSFWERTYPEVRKELRGRYPRHPWPEDPWTATPTARTRKKSP